MAEADGPTSLLQGLQCLWVGDIARGSAGETTVDESKTRGQGGVRAAKQGGG